MTAVGDAKAREVLRLNQVFLENRRHVSEKDKKLFEAYTDVILASENYIAGLKEWHEDAEDDWEFVTIERELEETRLKLARTISRRDKLLKA